MTPEIDGPPSVLALHGLGGGRFELAPLIEALGRAGSRVLAPVLPGHEVRGRVMPASEWADWARAAEEGFDELAALGRPVAVAGFSTGGTLGLWLATRRPVDRLVLLAPFLAIRLSGLIPVHPASYLRPVSWLIPHLPRRAAPVRDREARRGLESVDRFGTFSLHATLSALDLIDRVRPIVPEIRAPTLILQGRRDTVVEPDAVAWLASHLGSSTKDLIWFDRSDHLLLLDLERDRVLETALSFLIRRQSPR